jgi:hypothetical protein
MGGYGSGRRWGSSKDTTSDYRQLDVRRWQRDGFLLSGRFFGWQWSRDGKVVASIQVKIEADRVILSYRHRRNDWDPWQSREYPVFLDWTRCNYGGARAWFLCPAMGCGRRVAILYMGGGIFACRHCHQLAYGSQREPAHYRALSRAQAIREKLGGSGSMAYPFPPRPKGMHFRTYLQLCRKYEDAESRCWPPWLLKQLASGR